MIAAGIQRPGQLYLDFILLAMRTNHAFNGGEGEKAP